MSVTINHEAVLMALRAKLATLEVVNTGAVTLAADTNGFTRASGSFVLDGFAVGMELNTSSFLQPENNGTKTITRVSAGNIFCEGTVPESAGARTITVGLPSGIASENTKFEPVRGEPWIKETYIRGAWSQISLGSFGETEALPVYVLGVYVPLNVGILAATRYVDHLLTVFAPGTPVVVAGHSVHVRRDTAPFVSELLPDEGYSVITVTVPLRVRAANTV